MKKRIFSIASSILFSLSIFAKQIPLELSQLVNDSELIAIVDIFEVKSLGKSQPGYAKASIREVLLGNVKSELVNINWNGIAITELGLWVVFLKNDADEYLATNGARAFWKVENSVSVNGGCCTPFVVLRPPVSYVDIDPVLVSERPTYVNSLPRGKNLIQVSGIEIDVLKHYIMANSNKDE